MSRREPPRRVLKLPWEKDPDDLEANYRRPVPRREWVRLYLKALCVVLAGVWFKFAIESRTHEGAKLSLAMGFALVGAATVDLLYLRDYEIEQIFLSSKRQQVIVRTVVLTAGVALLIAAALAYSR